VQVRLGFYSRAGSRPLDVPEITGQGFTVQKFQQPDQPRIETLDGRSYEVWTFKTAIAAARPGKFDIGPAQATAIVTVPRRQGNPRSRSPFNMDDPFSDPFFADPFGAFGQQEKAIIKSEPASLEVKPLPKNAPADFSGAVGNFAMTVEASPKSVQVGDPITVTASISGRGNFDRMSAPTLEDEGGWHKYPPSSKFKQDDDVGISGTKTFETVLSPNDRKQSIPPLHFSFFDPIKEQYATLKSDSIPIRVEGGTASARATVPPSSAARAPVATSSTPAPQPTKPGDILGQLTDRPAAAQSFAPWYLRPTFWLLQLIPLIGLLGLIGWKVRQARLGDREARRTAALHREAAELIRQLRRDGATPQEYYSQASRAVRIRTALATNADPNAVDADAAAAAFHLDETSREQLRRLFERSDELRYSGAHNGYQTVPAEQRHEVLELIDNLRT
ncbi:MAG TPA: BatD family protein, partial [Bryobacteraceae bacterium]|nr:BatD family protein [Bryobacteraceae bacterium]